MNATEREFALMLEFQKNAEQIVSYDYEGITLRWPDGMTYTPDFHVITSVESPSGEKSGAAIRMTLIEVKGPHCWPKDLVKWRAAKAHWPLFRFEFWRKADGRWTQER